MMDFNLILLLVGLGLLLLVSVFVLLGCFAGLKKELKCTAIAFVLLLLALLVFGNSSTLLDINGSLLKSFIQGIPDSAVTVWDCVLALVRDNVPGGTELFVEGTKSYAFLYSVVSGVARGAMLIIGTFAMFIIIMIVVGVYRLVTRIIAGKKARQRAALGICEPEPEVEGANENVLVAQDLAGEAEGTMITASKEPTVKKPTQHRVWAGLLAGLRAVIVIFFLFAPVSGITSVLDSISPETETLINEALSGNQQNTATDDTILDIAIDFKDAYYDSALGKFVEGSQFFFGESFSTKLFDSAFKIDTELNSIAVREEAIVFIEAVNALEGNIKLDALKESQIVNALNALKDSELIVEAMPVAVEAAYYYPINANGSITFLGNNQTLGEFLFASNQQAAFLRLRQLDWDKNIEVLLDAVAEAYKLGFLEEDFNVLTMDPQVLRETLGELAKSDAVNSILNIAIQVALNHEKVTEIVGPLPAADLSDFDWAQEYETIVSIYEDFQKFGITSFEGFNAGELVEEILNDEEKLQIVVSLVEKVTELQLVNEVAYDAAIGYVSNMALVKDSGTDIVEAVKNLADINWSNDINLYVEALTLALPLVEFEEGLKVKVDYLNLDADVVYSVVDKLLTTKSFTEILPIATNIALSLPQVQKLFGNQEIVINTANVNWNKDFTSLVNIYRTFQELDIETLDELTKDPLGLVKEIFASDEKVATVNSVLAQLADLTLFTEIATPAANVLVNNIINEKAPSFAEILDLSKLSKEQWKDDFENLIHIAENVYEICGFNFNLSKINFYELSGSYGQQTLELLFNLNLLGDNQTKTDLVVAALVQFKVLDEAQVAELDLSNVVWVSNEGYSEVSVFQQLFALVARISKLEGVDLANLKFDYNEILSRDDSYELIIDVLDVLVESELVLELLPSVLDKYAVPLVEKFEDEDNTLQQIITGLESEVLVEEIKKLVDVVKAVVELNVLEFANGGTINSIDLGNTDAIKTIINGILDSKLLEGYESRVVRILLKVTKLFPNLEKGIFDEVDFDREQAILIQVIDDVEVILQDENFLQLDDNGKIKLDPLYFTKDAQLDALLSALKTLFGEYQGITLSEGSEIIEILLPEVFGKFVTPLIPEQFAEVIDILDIENQHPRTLAEDLRKVIYIAETLVDVKVQSYLEEKDYNFAGAADAIQTVISTVFDLGMITNKEDEVIAWALNYVQSSAKLNLGEFTAKDFAGVDWDLEVEVINELIDDVIKFTNNNKISSVSSLIKFIKDKGFLKDEFFVIYNYNVAFEIIEDLFSLQTVEQILPVGLEYALNLAKEKDIDVTFLGDNMTGELLVEDVMSIVEALKIAVYDIDIMEYKKANWAGELPAVESVVEILDIIINLNVLDAKYNQLLSFAVNKFLPANDYIKASDFSFDTQYNFMEDWEIIKEVFPLIYDVIYANNMTTIEEVKAFVTEKWYANTDLVKDYNILFAADLVDLLAETQLVQQALVAVIKNAVKLESINKIGNFASLQDLTKPELVSDIHTLTDVLRQAIDANLLQYYELHDLDPINYEALANILETVGTLNILNKCSAKVLPSVVNNILSKNANLNINYEFTNADFAALDWATETELLGEVLVKVGALAETNNLDSLSDILLFISNKDFLNPAVVTEANVNEVIEILDIAVDSKLIQAVAVAGVEYALDLAKSKGFDLTFLKGKLSGEQLVSDLNVIVQIAQNAVDFGAIEYLTTQNIENINVDYVVEIVALLEQLNILTCAQPEWAAFVVGKVAPLLKLDVTPLAANYKFIDYAAENELLQEVVRIAGEMLDNVNIHSVEEIKAYISNKDFLNINTYNDRVINNVQSLLLIASESNLLGVHLVDLVEYAANLGGKAAKLDLSFVNHVFTRGEIQADLVTLVDIIEKAEEFGIVDLIFTGDVEINLDSVIEIVELLEQLNLLNKTNDYIAELVFNMILPKLGLEKAHVDDFKYIDFAAENAILVSVLEEAKALLAAEGFTKVSDVLSFVNNKEYASADTYEKVYSQEALESIERIVNLAVTSELVQLELVPLFNLAISKVPASINVGFLKDGVTTEELVHDVPVLVSIAKQAVEFGALEYVFTKDLTLDNIDALIEAVPLFENVTILTKYNKEIAELVYNMILPKLGLEKVEAADFNSINFTSENAVLVSALEAVKELVEAEGFAKVSDILSFINGKEFLHIDKYEEVYNDAAILSVEKLVEVASTSELIKLELVPLFNFAISKVPAQFDVKFLQNSVTADELASDLNVLVDISKLAVEFGVLDYIFTKEIADVNVNPLIEAVALLEQVNILTNNNKEIAAFAFNFAYDKLGIKPAKRAASVNAAEFENINFAAENEALQDALQLVGEIRTDLQLASLTDIINFVVNKEYANTDQIAAVAYTHAEELVGVLVDTQLAQYALPTLLDFGLDKVAALGVDLTYLSGQFTGAELASDVKVLVSEAVRWVRNNGIIEAIQNKEIKANYLDELAITVKALKDVNIANVEQAKLVTIITNLVYKNVLKYSESIDESYFNGVNWSAEYDAVAAVLVELGDILETFGVEHNLLSLEGLKEFAKVAKDTTIYDQELVASLADVLNAISKSEALLSEAQFGLEYAAAFLSMKNVDIYAIDVTNEELAADLVVLSEVLVDVYDSNVLGFALNKEALNQAKVAGLIEAVEAILALNVVEDVRAELIVLALSKAGIEVEKADLEAINWNTEIEVIGDLLTVANDALVKLELSTLDDIKTVNFKEYLTVNYETNDLLEIIADVLEVAVESELVEAVLFPVSEKFLSSDKLAGLADLHNIYANFDEVAEDVEKLVEVIDAVIELNLCSFLVEGSDIPYENKAAVEKILTNVFALNYLNNDGRLEELITKFVKMNTSSIDFSAIDLEADAAKLVDAYEALLPILTDEKFFLKNKEDFKKVSINVKYWSKEQYVSAIKDAFETILDTTIVEESNGAVFLFAIPLLKKAAPDYYEAIDPERLTAEQLSEDFNSIVELVELALESNVNDLLNGKVFTNDAKELVVAAIETILELNLLEGKLDDIANVTADRLDAKRIGSYYFDKSSYNLTDVQYEQDLEVIIDIINYAFELLQAEGVVSIDDAKAFFKDNNKVKGLFTKAERFAVVEKIAQLLPQLTIVKHNALAVYNEALQDKLAKVVGSDLANLAAVYSTSEELTAELETVVEILMLLNDASLFQVIDGAYIKYDQAALVKEILSLVAELEYVEANKQNLLEFVDSKLPLDLSSINVSSMDLDADLAILGEIYEQLIPVLVSSHNPFTTVKAIKKAEIAKSDLYALIYDYQTIYPSVVVLASQLSEAPQLVKFAVSQVKGNGLIVEFIRSAVAELNDNEIREDLVVLADVLTHVEKLEVLRKVLYKEDIAVTDNATISALVASVFELNMVDNYFEVLLETVCEEVVKLDVTNVELDEIDVEAEQELLVALVDKLVVAMNAVGVDQLSEIKPYLSNTLSAVKADVKEAVQLLSEKSYRQAVKALVETLVAEGSKVGGELSLEVFDLLCESQLLVKLALPVYEQKVYTKLNGVLAEVGDLGYYAEGHLEDDVKLINNIVHNLYESKLYQVLTIKQLPGEECVPYLEAIIADACSLSIVDANIEDLEIVLQKVFGDHINVNAINFSIIDLRDDAEEFAATAENIYVLVREILNNGLNKNLVFNTVAYNAAIDAYEDCINTTLVQAVAPQVIKALSSLLSEKLGGTVATLINALDIESIYDTRLLQDLPVYAEILRDLEAVDAYSYLLNKEDIAIVDVDALAKLAEDAFSLVVVDHNFQEVLVKFIEKVLGVDLSAVDMNIDYEAEQEILVELVRNGVTALNALGVDQLSEIKPYLKNTLSAVKADVKEAVELIKAKEVKAAVKALLNTAMDEARKLNGENCLEIIDLVVESELVAKLILPVYEQKVYTRLDGILAVIGDLSDYNEELLVEDLGLLAEIAHDVYDSKLYKVISARELPGDAAVAYLEDIIRNAASLNIVDVKKEDVLVVAQAVLDKLGVTSYIRKLDADFDLAKYDASSISFKADADIYASMAQYLYVACEGLLESGFNASFFGNTEAIKALVEVYTISIDTSLVRTFASKALNAVSKLAAKFKSTVNENDVEVLYNISDFLFGAIELGVFSNNGIDFTDAATIEMMKECVFDSVTLPGKVQSLIEKVCARAYAYGVVPFDWNQVSISHEAKVYYNLAKQALRFVQANASSIKALDLSMLADANVQADLTEMAYSVSESSFVQQLFFPFVEGTFKALTLGYTDGEMTYNATIEDVLAYSLPNFWKVVNAGYELTGFKVSGISLANILANLDAVAEIVEVFGTDIMLKDNAAKFIATGIGVLTSHDLTADQIAALEAIDFANEVQYSNEFFAILADTYAAHPFTIGTEMFKDKDVILGVAAALEAILPSETVKVLARTGLEIVNNRIASKLLPEASELAASRLEDPTFTDDQVIADLYILVDVLRNAANSGILENRTDYSAWNFAAIKAIVNNLFDTNLAAGYEAEFSEACITRIPVVSEFYDSSMVITNWEAEIITILNAIESLVNDGITSMSDISVDNLSGATVGYICDSVILSDILVEKINDKLEALGVSDYYVATSAKLNAVVDWDAELAAIKDLNNLLDSLNNGTYVLADVVAKYENIKANTVLVNDVLTNSAEYMVPKMPVVKTYYDSSTVITDWAAELDAIVSAIKTLDSMGLDAMSDPIENLSGDAVLVALSSTILKTAFVEEFNNNLVTLGLGSYYTVTAVEVESVQTAADWDKELTTIQNLQGLLEKINNSTVTPADVYAVKAEAEQTQIAKDIFTSVLAANGIII